MGLRQFPKNGKISLIAEQGKLTVLVAKLQQYLKRLGQSSRLELIAAPDGVPLFVSHIQRGLTLVFPFVTAGEMAEILGVGLATVKRRLGKLQHEGRIRHIGSDKTGHWEVVGL